MPVLYRRLCIFLAALIPLVWILYKTFAQLLGADPAKTLVLFTGEWAFNFLLLTLAVTPLRRLSHHPVLHFRWLSVHRRMLGLFTLFYALLHVLAFLVFILGLDFARFSNELVQRPYILVSLPAFVLLIALGVTSTQSMMRRLGKRWVKLHQSIYVIALLAWVHVAMQIRSSYFEAAVFGGILLVLFAPRLVGGLRHYLAIHKGRS